MEGQTIQVFVKGYLGKTLKLFLKKDSPVSELFRNVSNTIGTNDIKIIYAAKQLRSIVNGNATILKDYGIDDKAILFGCIMMTEDDGSSVEEKPTSLNGVIEFTNSPDMLTLDDDQSMSRIKMPCGHAIGQESLKEYCRRMLDDGKFEFVCPSSDPCCGEIWDYRTVRKLAVLTKEEQNYFEEKLSEIFLKVTLRTKDCPNCSSLSLRPNGNNFRVICMICQLGQRHPYEFCWYCLGAWSTSDNTDCGNSTCDAIDLRLRYLKSAGIKDINGVKCPSMRACPACGYLIEHTEGCKQMSCRCGQKFCFVCLKIAINGNFQCGATCNVAPVQHKFDGN
ncbi:hypothetical protein ACJMK2_039392 [Sinanodonta woodiana]|uniref:RBR-type E3 ubiquitin transferase n=1 Tax=Sinanodonta woodiana TaxID=1069815 RepID=A0ABD3WF41_SINWO